MKKGIVSFIGCLLLWPFIVCGKVVEDPVTVLKNSMTQEADGKMYIGIKEISPLSNLERLCEVGQVFYEHGMPFSVEITPLREAVEELRLRQYVQVLNYIQSKGGAIYLADKPIENESEQYQEPIRQLLALEGVDLIQLPQNIYLIDFKTLERLAVDQRPFPKLGVDVLIGYELPMTSEDTLKMIQQIQDKWLSLSSLQEEKSYTFDEEWLQNGEDQELEIGAYNKIFAIGDKILLIIVSLSLLVLGVGIGIGYKLYKEKFYK